MCADLLEAIRALGPRVRELALCIETERRLDPELAAELGRVGVWRACVPRSVGGLEIPFPSQLEVFEELSHADGSAGWCAMIGATSGLVYAYLDPGVARDILAADAAACTGGVFAPSGRAVEVAEGLRVTGRWAFGSGVQHCARMGLGVVVMDGDAPRLVRSGAPDFRAVLVDAGDYGILDTWTVSGLRGTGSHDVAMADVLVPSRRSYVLIGGAAEHEGALYAFPFFGLLALSVAAVCLGIARSAIDELVGLAGAKTATGQRRRLAERPYVQMQVAQAEAELRAVRSFVYGSVGEAWERAEAGEEPTLAQRAVLRLAATNAARTSATVVDRMYEAGGGTSIYATSRLQRDFRDVHAATQHMVIAPATLELAGRVLLGVEADTSLL